MVAETTHQIRLLSTEEEARKVVDFFFSPDSFDDTRHTPGEEEHFRSLPYRALRGETVFWLATDEDGRVIGVNSIAENEQRTGGYSWDYIVVHRQYRRCGLASQFIREMLDYLEARSARYVLTYTCDLPPYRTIRRLFERNGFTLVGRCPDYYYEGEDRLIYCRKLNG